MERKEAIKLIEKDFDFVEKKVVNPLFWFDENGKEAIKLLLSTAKQVEKVVGKLKVEIPRLQKEVDSPQDVNTNTDAIWGELEAHRWLYGLLTEEE